MTSGSRAAAVRSLHDFTLKQVLVEWATAEVIFHLEGPEGPETLVAKGAQKLVLPHTEPWGPSAPINGVSSVPDRDDLILTRIEMQSGDVIEVLCQGVL